jgi:hypothetical protein
VNVIYIHMESHMPEAARLAYFGPLPWIALGAVIGVAVLGAHGIGAIVLAVLAIGFVAKRMYRWQAAAGGDPMAWANCAAPWSRRRDQAAAGPSPGNMAFDDYRREMLRRMEQDHQDFQSFLERLRRAKDKAEFDQFMAERDRGAPQGPSGEPPRNPWPNA